MNSSIITTLQAITRLKRGEVGIMPTDTVYGLVTLAANPRSVARMYHLKSRNRKPGTLIAASPQQLVALGVAQSDINKVAQWWPNPLSAVLDMLGNDYLHQGVGNIAMRVVADPAVKALLEQTGPLITSSANLPGQPEATTIAEAYAYFGDTIDFYVDGDTIANKIPSTIIRPSADGIEVLRQGDIHIAPHSVINAPHS
jgi:tRNA threonylcarbamoyl adenosine modification protein (Sua5/YciO/YrdC/YwlC family)